MYAHIPLIQNPDGSKMSKRDVGAQLGNYPEEGFLPDAVVNFIALLGWSPKSDDEVFTKDELINLFSLENVNRAAAKFDITKCKWMNQQHIMRLAPEKFVELAMPFCTKAGLEDTPQLREVLPSVQTKVQLLSETPAWVKWVQVLEYEEESMAKLQENAREMLSRLVDAFNGIEEWSGEAAFQLIKPLAKANGVAPFMIFSNATLMDMAKKRPKNTSEFKRVSGVGEMKAQWYGKDFLKVLKGAKS